MASAETITTQTEFSVVPKRPVGRPRKNSTHPLDIQKQQQQISSPVQMAIATTTMTEDKGIANNMSTSRLRLGELGSEGMAAIRDITNYLQPLELRWPTCLKTYEKMKLDSTVSAALDLGYILIEKRFNEGKIHFNKSSERSKEAAEFIEWCFDNMDGQTLRSIARNAATFREHGFSILEKVYTRVKDGKYKGWFKVSKLGYRHPLSLYQAEPFVFGGDGRELVSVKQDPSFFKNSTGFFSFPNSVHSEPITIERKKFILFGYNATDSLPLGLSPLCAAYKAWREKVILEDLEVTGSSKSLSGMPLIYIPNDILTKAAIDPTSPEARAVKALDSQMASLHAGEQAYMRLPSDLIDGSSTTRAYELRFLGIDGNSQVPNTKDLINDRKKAILDRLGAGFINLGNDSVGSYNLGESKSNLHGHYVERDCNIIEEGLNKDLIPQLLAMNNIFLPSDEIPYVLSGWAEDPSKDETSKVIQRTAAVGFLPATPEVINENFAMLGYNYRVPDDVAASPKKWQEYMNMYMPQFTSKSGAGMEQGTTGNGTAKSASTRDNSISNTENV